MNIDTVSSLKGSTRLLATIEMLIALRMTMMTLTGKFGEGGHDVGVGVGGSVVGVGVVVVVGDGIFIVVVVGVMMVVLFLLWFWCC